MAAPSLQCEVRSLLTDADEKLLLAEKALIYGMDQGRIIAEGRLVFLKRRKEELEDRSRELGRCPDDMARAVSLWIREDWMILMQRLDAWIEGRR